jgi:hypothetical protein
MAEGSVGPTELCSADSVFGHALQTLDDETPQRDSALASGALSVGEEGIRSIDGDPHAPEHISVEIPMCNLGRRPRPDPETEAGMLKARWNRHRGAIDDRTELDQQRAHRCGPAAHRDVRP